MGKHKQITLLSLYTAQAIPMSFFSSVVPVILREGNFSLELIGLLQFIKLPWILKLFWAPFVDNRTSTLSDYKRWIIRSELFYAVFIALIAFLHLETDFVAITALMVIAITASATQDIATDALSVRMLHTGTHSIGAGMQSMGGFIGALVGGGLLLIIYQRFGWSSLLLGLAGFVLLAMVPLILYSHPLKEYAPGTMTKKISLASIPSFFRQPGIGRQVVFLAFYHAGLMTSLAMLRPWLLDTGFSKADIGWLSGIAGTCAAAACSFLMGWWIRYGGIRRPSVVTSVLILLTMLYTCWVSYFQPGHAPYVYAVVGGIWGTYGMATVIIYTTAMRLVRSGYEGTDFTLQTVLVSLVGMVLAGVSGLIAGQWSYTHLFGFGAVLSLLFLFYNGWVYGKKR